MTLVVPERFYGQGMVRPGAWSLGGQIVRTEVDDLRCPAPDIWSKAAIAAIQQQQIINTFLNAQAQRSPVSSTQAALQAYYATQVGTQASAFYTSVAMQPLYSTQAGIYSGFSGTVTW